MTIPYALTNSYLWEDVTRAWIVPQLSTLSNHNHAQTLPILHSYDSNPRMYTQTSDNNNPHSYSNTYSHPFSQTMHLHKHSNSTKHGNDNGARRAKSYGRADDFGFQFNTSKPTSEIDLVHRKIQNHYCKPNTVMEKNNLDAEGTTLIGLNSTYDYMLGNIYDNHIPNEYEYHMNYPNKFNEQTKLFSMNIDEVRNNIPVAKENGRSWCNILEPSRIESLQRRTIQDPYVSYSNGQESQIFLSHYPPGSVLPGNVINNNQTQTMHERMCLPIQNVYPDLNKTINSNFPVNHITTIHNHNHRHNHIHKNHESPKKSNPENVSMTRKSNRDKNRVDQELGGDACINTIVCATSTPYQLHNSPQQLISNQRGETYLNYTEVNNFPYWMNYSKFPNGDHQAEFLPISPMKSSQNKVIWQQNYNHSGTPEKSNNKRKIPSNSPLDYRDKSNTKHLILRQISDRGPANQRNISPARRGNSLVEKSTAHETFCDSHKPIETLKSKYEETTKFIRRQSPKQRASKRDSFETIRKGSESTPNIDNLRGNPPSPNFEAWASSRAVFVMPPSRFMDEPAYSSTF